MHRLEQIVGHFAPLPAAIDSAPVSNQSVHSGPPTEASVRAWAADKPQRELLARTVIAALNNPPKDGTLRLSNLMADELPPNLGEVPWLKRLTIDDMDSLATLSPALDNAKSLRDVSLTNLPRLDLSNVAALSKLPQLQYLSVVNVPLDNDKAVDALINSNLIELAIEDCSLTKVPESINQERLPNLKSLSVAGNPIADRGATDEMWPDLMNFSMLHSNPIHGGANFPMQRNERHDLDLDDRLTPKIRREMRDVLSEVRNAWEQKFPDVKIRDADLLPSIRSSFEFSLSPDDADRQHTPTAKIMLKELAELQDHYAFSQLGEEEFAGMSEADRNNVAEMRAKCAEVLQDAQQTLREQFNERSSF